ncbi:MAG TPA: hypothetical protein VIS29_02595, partial [Streptomyces sp.]
ASPGEQGSALPYTGPSSSSPGPPATAGSATPPDTGDGAESATDEGGTGQGGPDNGSKDTDARGRNGTGDGSENATGARGKAGDPTDAEARELYEKTLRQCRHYREGTLDDRSRRRLIQLAKGEANLDRFCDHLLDKTGRDGDGDDRGGNNNGGGGNEGRTGDGDGGSIPSVSFE